MNNQEDKVFVYSIKVRWSDCDPANIVYTAKIPAIALDVIDSWWEAYVGLDWYKLIIDKNIGTPFVHLEMNFHKPLTPRHSLICKLYLLKLGNSSITHFIEGYMHEQLCFDGKFVSVFCQADTMIKIPAPEQIYAKIGHLQTNNS